MEVCSSECLWELLFDEVLLPGSRFYPLGELGSKGGASASVPPAPFFFGENVSCSTPNPGVSQEL